MPRVETLAVATREGNHPRVFEGGRIQVKDSLSTLPVPSSTDNGLCSNDRYLRALAAFYVRLTFDSLNVYEVLEPLLDDYRKLRFRGMGKYLYFLSLRISH